MKRGQVMRQRAAALGELLASELLFRSIVNQNRKHQHAGHSLEMLGKHPVRGEANGTGCIKVLTAE